jgi:transposase-like protein
MEQANANGSAVKKRIHRSEEEILKDLSEQEESEISVKEYCEMFDINEATFYSWIKKYRKSEEEEKGSRNDGTGFATIEIVLICAPVQCLRNY